LTLHYNKGEIGMIHKSSNNLPISTLNELQRIY